MTTERDLTLAGLKTAIQMEIEGKEFYLKSGQASSNDLGRKLLNQLAKEEDLHRMTFEGIYKKISVQKGWPVTKVGRDRIKGLKTLFAEAMEAMSGETKGIPTELNAIEKAMDMENKTYDFYVKRSSLATYSGEKKLYEEIAGQEKEHHSVLLDYFEFLKNPAFYFVRKEHLSVDGG
jgi:rubrerythrin